MTDDIFVYYINIPGNINELITPCFGGYTIYIDKRLDRLHQIRAYQHAMQHIKRCDFEREENATVIELYAHQ